MTTGSLIIAGILALLMIGAVVSMVLEKRSGKCSCGCDCGCCECRCEDGPITPKE